MMPLVCKDVRPEYIRTLDGSKDGNRGFDDVSSSNGRARLEVDCDSLNPNGSFRNVMLVGET